MGYRNYIGSLPKSEYEKIKNFTKDELYKHKNVNAKDDSIGVYDITDKELYEFGKYCEFKTKGMFKPVFLDEELQEEFTDESEFYIVGKKFLKAVIENYTEKVKKIYVDLLDGITNEHVTFKEIPADKALKLFEHVHGNSFEWLQVTPYNLDSGDAITTSWKYEYSIFELVKIYKTFDWKNNIMIYYGY
jgi:hypothetical protein